MGKTDFEALTKDELIELILAQYEQLTNIQADYEALKLRFEKNQKPYNVWRFSGLAGCAELGSLY
jgi:hypothetical protein